jgi:hypothetical protein
LLGPFTLREAKGVGFLDNQGVPMTDVFTRAAEAAKVLLHILQLVGALKDAANDLDRKHKAGKPVRKRLVQFKANLAAVLAADKAQAELDEINEEAFLKSGEPAQLELDLDKSG